MITTVTLNPMLDKTVRVARLERGKIHRSSSVGMVAGGKGINVSRQLNVLGATTIATGFMGGKTGEVVLGLLANEGIGSDFVLTEGPTREGVSYLEEDGTVTGVFEPPQEVTTREVDALVRKAESFIDRSSWLICSGSSPCRTSDNVFRSLIHYARTRGVSSVLDSYGDAFRLGVEALPTMVKPNREEFESTFGVSVTTEHERRDALRRIVGKGIRYAILTDGSAPVFAQEDETCWRVTPPVVTAVNATGSGDAFVAAAVLGLSSGWTFEQSLRFGAAAGAANAAQWSVADSPRSAIDALVPGVHIHTCT